MEACSRNKNCSQIPLQQLVLAVDPSNQLPTRHWWCP